MYKLLPNVKEVDVWGSQGKITVNKDATQAQLEYLFSINYEGVIQVEEAKKPKK